MTIYSIYKATNIINGKSYIGFDSNWPSRKEQHKKDSKNTKKDYCFYNAIRKYGWQNFQFELIYQSKEWHHCKNVMENYFIEEYRTYIRFEDCKGYNMTLGGEGTLGYRHTPENKEKVRLLALGNTRTLGLTNEKRKELGYSLITGKPKGSKECEETKRKKSETRKGKTTVKDKDGNCFLVECNDERFKSGEFVSVYKGINIGRKHSDETRNKLSLSRIGKEPWNKGKKGLQTCKYKDIPRPKLCCIICKKEVDVGNLGRHHKHLPKKND